MNEVFAFEVTVVGKSDWGMVINHRSAGKAKSAYLLELSDCWPDIPYTALRVRKVGKPRTSSDFRRIANYRGLPELRCGDRVSFGVARGVLVTHGGGANFGVLVDVDSPKYANRTVYVHPSELTLEESK